jgi:hypothetical protein
MYSIHRKHSMVHERTLRTPLNSWASNLYKNEPQTDIKHHSNLSRQTLVSNSHQCQIVKRAIFLPFYGKNIIWEVFIGVTMDWVEFRPGHIILLFFWSDPNLIRLNSDKKILIYIRPDRVTDCSDPICVK